MRVKVRKTGIDGVGKLQEEIPAGFSFQVLNSANGKVLSDEAGRLKIVWLTLPLADQFEITYKLIHHGKTKGDYLIRGVFSYVEGPIKRTYELQSSKIFIAETTERKGGLVVEKAQKLNYTEEGQLAGRMPEEDTPALKVLPVSAEIPGNFVIQLGVYSTEKDPRVFKGLPDIHYLRVNNYYKYFSGHYPNKEVALNRLKEVKEAGFEEAFVTELKP